MNKIRSVKVMTLPISSLGDVSEGRISLPLTLPFSFGDVIGGKIRLPATLPISFRSNQRKDLKIPTKEYVEYEGTKLFKIPTKETAWQFRGLIMEEYVVEKMNSSLTLIEDVRSRILTNITMLNNNNVEVSWFGDEVPMLGVYKKMTIDEEYELVSQHAWKDSKAKVQLDNAEYDIMLIGLNQTGESGAVTVGESNYLDVFTQVNVAMNEKIYTFDVDLTSQYRINVNL